MNVCEMRFSQAGCYIETMMSDDIDDGVLIILTQPDKLIETFAQIEEFTSSYDLKSKGIDRRFSPYNNYALTFHKAA